MVFKQENQARGLRAVFGELLLPFQTEDVKPEDLDENFTRLGRVIGEFERPTDDLYGKEGFSGIEFLARMLGGQLLIAEITYSTSATSAGDTEIPHDLGRIPKLLVFSWSLIGWRKNNIRGFPGGNKATAANESAWTDSHIYVRNGDPGDERLHAIIVI